MRLTRCFCPLPLQPGALVTLPPGASAHLTRVLRLRPGAALTVFDGRGGEYAADLAESTREGVRVRIGEHRAVEREARVSVTLLQSLLRGERMDWVVQKATELGVTRILPVASEHAVVQMEGATAARRLTHWQAVAIGACEQSGRNRLPELHAAQQLESTCAQAAALGPVRLLLSPQASESLPAMLTGGADPGAPPHVSVLIGPEGGFSDAELAAARRHGFRACRLGPRTLRAETAPLAALAAIQAAIGDFR